MAQFGIKLEFHELERLIKAQGEDFSILLSQNVLAQFADKYVKKIEHSEFAESLREKTGKVVENVARSEGFVTKNSYRGADATFELAPIFKEKLKGYARDALDDHLREYVRATVHDLLDADVKKFIKETVEVQVQRMTAKEVSRQVEAKLTEIRRQLG